MLWEVKAEERNQLSSHASLARRNIQKDEGIWPHGFGGRTQIAAVLEKAQPDVYVATIQAGPSLKEVRRLSIDTSSDYPHAWTRDSETVIFESNRDGHFRLYRRRLDQRRAEAITANAGGAGASKTHLGR